MRCKRIRGKWNAKFAAYILRPLSGIRSLLLVLAFFTAATSCAQALPGQSIESVCLWAKHNASMRQVLCADGSEGEIAYLSARFSMRFSDRFTFESHPDTNGRIVREVLTYRHLPNVSGVNFTRKSAALEVLQSLFGGAIASDFAAARLAAVIRKNRIYQGRRFTYLVVSYEVLDQGQPLVQQKSIWNSFMVFAQQSRGAAEQYARTMRGGI